MKEKKKILFVITKGSPLGGAQQYVYDLAVNAPKEFEAVVACGPGELFKERLKDAKIKVIDLEHSQREVDAKKDWSVFWELVKIIKEEEPDILHLNSSKIGILGAIAGIVTRVKKVIFTSHGWGFNEMHRPLVSKILYMFGHFLTLLLVHQTIAVSHKTKKDVSWMPFVSRKIKVIHNGIAKFKLKTKKEARFILTGEENSLPAQAGKKIIIFSLSELHKNKGLDIALRALARLPDQLRKKIIYCIAGSGEEKENLEKLTENLGIKDMVRFLGFVPNAKELLSGVDIFLFPSRTENLPYGVLEAGWAGIPIIAASVGGVPEIITNMQDGVLVHPRNPREIAEAIIYMIENKDRSKIFKEKIKQKVSGDFSIDKMLSQTYSLYGRLVD